MTKAQGKIKRWREDPLSFAIDNFKFDPDPWQADALRALGGQMNPRRRVTLKAATGVGKSAVLAIATWHRLTCFAGRGQHPKGACLSGEGWTNLQTNLWSELSKWQSRSEFLKAAFEWTQKRVFARDHAETWFVAARSYPSNANAEALGVSLSGLHSEYPFIILDETGMAPPAVGQKAEQIFTGGVKDGLFLQAGNPTSTSGLLYVSAMAGDQTIITITADPDDPKRSSRVDPEHARNMIEKYGRTNAWVKSTILGEFPDTAINTLMSVDDVEKAMRRQLDPEAYRYAQKRIGVDVARFGSDATVLFPRQGLNAFPPVEMRGARTNEIAARVALAKSNWGSELELIDDTGGWGAGVVDQLLQAGHKPTPVNFSGKAQSEKYLNARAEMWWRMADWVKRGGALPHLPEIVKEFATPQYSFQSGRFVLEPKEQVKKRLGHSTDHGDALALTFYFEERPGGMVIPQNLQGAFSNYSSEWNPYSDEHSGW